MPRPRIVVDAMGGDHAPEALVAGARLAASAGEVQLTLVGDHARLTALLAGDERIDVVGAASVVEMDEDPAIALRSKRDSSIRRAAERLAAGEADALVSAGSTGATLAAALLVVGRARGIRRPAVAAVLPVGRSGVVLVDAGGSSTVQPEELPVFARMGAAYAAALGVEDPRVGLLNVGSEPGKGNELAKAAHALLADDPAFVGNVEPDAVLGGAVDVVVTDGFTGNIFLKTVEAGHGDGPPDADAEQPAGAAAAVVLGVRAPVLVAHGAAGPEAIAAAITGAARIVSRGLTDDITRRLAGAGTAGERSR